MATESIILPKMGESVAEATIIKWLKKEGDPVELEEVIIEIATDKVDTEVFSPFAGKLSSIKCVEGEVVQVGTVIAEIETDAPSLAPPVVKETIKEPIVEPVKEKKSLKSLAPEPVIIPVAAPITPSIPIEPSKIIEETTTQSAASDRFYSPLVRSIAKKEGMSLSDLEKINGTGKEGRLTKADLLKYLSIEQPVEVPSSSTTNLTSQPPPITVPSLVAEQPKTTHNGADEIIEMDRVRQLISSHMTMSQQTSAHVTSFIELDVTSIVMWRNANKETFKETHDEPLTFTPIFIEALVKTIQQFPMINSSLDGNKIILKKDINVGMATALPSGNLIVPVIKNADRLNLMGIIKKVNDLAIRARNKNLGPDDTSGGTYTITNVGSFGSIMGTPIINQPQVAIMAVGAITKKPAVIETPQGDTIGIRHMMYLSHTYDHRIIDGALGSKFLKMMADHLENFDSRRKI